MGNYREQMSKNMCAFNAIAWTLIIAGHIITGWEYYSQKSRVLGAALLLLALFAVGVHWYRWLAYDKKSKNIQEDECYE